MSEDLQYLVYGFVILLAAVAVAWMHKTAKYSEDISANFVVLAVVLVILVLAGSGLVGVYSVKVLYNYCKPFSDSWLEFLMPAACGTFMFLSTILFMRFTVKTK